MAEIALSMVIARIAMAAAALAALFAAGWLWRRRDRYGDTGTTLFAALCVTALWGGAAAMAGPHSIAEAITGSLRDLVWLLAIYRLFASDGRLVTIRQLRPLVAALVFIELLQPLLLATFASRSYASDGRDAAFLISALFRLLVAAGGLVLVHNLYSGAAPAARLAMRWPASALAAIWIVDLNYFAICYLAQGAPVAFAALRGASVVVASGLIALGARRGSDALRVQPSRTVAFQTVSLLLIGGYLTAMMAIAHWLAQDGTDFASAVQIGFVAVASITALVVLPSRRVRAWLNVMLAKHLFRHRYDYREEWLRLMRTMASGGAQAVPIEERTVRALAQITDSPAGLLLTPDDGARLALATRWQWPTIEVPAAALDEAAAVHFERSGYIVEIDEVRAAVSAGAANDDIPWWILDDPRAWAMVPLLHFDRLVGIVVLARPSFARRLDWEDFDLLRVAGQQLASFLAESSGQQLVAEASRFEDFNRRIAFVMHDIKNLASQLGLLARNAEQHVDNPEFRSDMLVTLRNSADKLQSLLARLSRYGAGTSEACVLTRLDELTQALLAQFQLAQRVQLVRADACEVTARPEALEQAILHLVQNAVDASGASAPVFVSVAATPTQGVIEVTDAGSGMSADFIRRRLFKPFDLSKPGGFGIGAYEARELVRAMGGTLEVESREGLGSRFIVRLPRVDATGFIDSMGEQYKRTA